MLESASDAKAGDVVRRAAVDVLAAQPDDALAAIDATDAVENAGLAGAVRADQRQQFTGLHRKRHVGEDGKPAEAQR